ncbi:leucine-rich repeat domain-containing protein [Bacteroides faecis]
MLFFCCTQLSKINLHDNISEIGNASFHKCTSLKTVKLPSNLNKISKQLFISSGIKDIDIPEAVTTIETEAFFGLWSKKK